MYIDKYIKNLNVKIIQNGEEENLKINVSKYKEQLLMYRIQKLKVIKKKPKSFQKTFLVYLFCT